ncbi:MAG: hypothetical protein CR982_09365 [Candidatus Cloacimonadota bacterium]|nr:MAG: hypothetical protein CR982_09365 [Candidatus Cloacimonadota bacterium]PIE77517.1 MAG: hypothetical protein CSA15_12655 [Candidatus Delongbacteria bacterium]
MLVGKRNSFEKSRNRLRFLLMFMFIPLFVIVFRLFVLQIFEHDKYRKMYTSQTKRRNVLSASRGKILDRNSVVLAQNSGELYRFGLIGSRVDSLEKVANTLSSITGKKREYYIKKLKGKKKFVLLDEGLTLSEKKEIYEKLDKKVILGVSFDSYRERIYNYDKVGGQILGFVDKNLDGKSGVERKLNNLLVGKDGYEVVRKDGKNRYTTHSYTINSKKPVAGKNVVLTIDWKIQAFVQNELEKCVKKWKAKKATGIVMNPKNGEILAIGSYPDFDPNNPGSYDPYARKNKAVTDQYEPGSVIKPITGAILFEKGLTKENDIYFCDNKGVKIANKTIRDSHKNENEYMSFEDVIAKSSNVGTVKASMRLKKETMYEYLRAFGFGKKTGIEISGEVNSKIPPLERWSKLTLPTVSFGQGIATTPLQVAMAYCAIANNGLLYNPMLIKGIFDEEGNIVKEYEPEFLRKVISPESAYRVRKMLTKVVSEDGTAPQAYIEGLHVAGKTGTSQKVVNGKYSRTDYDASFVGMYPYHEPEIVCLVVVDSPKPYHWGGTVAAPVFKNIVNFVYNRSKGKKKYKIDEVKNRKVVPQLKNMGIDRAKKILEKEGIVYSFVDPGERITNQSIAPGTFVSDTDTLYLSGKVSITKGKKVFPNLENKSLRDGIANIKNYTDVKVVAMGYGNILYQSIKPGSLYETAEVCTLYCESYYNNIVELKNEAKKNIR